MSIENRVEREETQPEPEIPYWMAGAAAFAVHSFVEPYIVLVMRNNLEAGQLNPIQEYGTYYWGDFNNAFGLAAVFDYGFNKGGIKNKSNEAKKASALLAAGMTAAIFTAIEWEDKKDLPAAYMGAWTYAATRISYINSPGEELTKKLLGD